MLNELVPFRSLFHEVILCYHFDPRAKLMELTVMTDRTREQGVEWTKVMNGHENFASDGLVELKGV